MITGREEVTVLIFALKELPGFDTSTNIPQTSKAGLKIIYWPDTAGDLTGYRHWPRHFRCDVCESTSFRVLPGCSGNAPGRTTSPSWTLFESSPTGTRRGRGWGNCSNRPRRDWWFGSKRWRWSCRRALTTLKLILLGWGPSKWRTPQPVDEKKK